jgi:hypothetical protein
LVKVAAFFFKIASRFDECRKPFRNFRWSARAGRNGSSAPPVRPAEQGKEGSLRTEEACPHVKTYVCSSHSHTQYTVSFHQSTLHVPKIPAKLPLHPADKSIYITVPPAASQRRSNHVMFQRSSGSTTSSSRSPHDKAKKSGLLLYCNQISNDTNTLMFTELKKYQHLSF